MTAAAKITTEERKPGVRELAAQATRDSILKAAIKVFAKSGFDGGRVEQISKAAKSYDRMIYYYFGSKEGLYIAALEEIYRRFNEAESELQLDESKPREALRKVLSDPDISIVDVNRRTSHKLKHFNTPTTIYFSQDQARKRTILIADNLFQQLCRTADTG